MTEYRIALAGNPNVGKSTIFNSLTGMHQHTGNWPGKTVERAEGVCRRNGCVFRLIDLPGTYSLYPHSPEETAARDYLCRETPDAVLCVVDATCIERSLPLVLQICEITPRVAVCVNLIDEAERSGIEVDTARLSQLLGVPVLGVSAHRKKTLQGVLPMLERTIRQLKAHTPITLYEPPIESALSLLTPILEPYSRDSIYARYWALRLLENEEEWLTDALREDREYQSAYRLAREALLRRGFDAATLRESLSQTLLQRSSAWAKETATERNTRSAERRFRLDRALTGRTLAYPLMIALLMLVLFLTLEGANYPSRWLSELFGIGEVWLKHLLRVLRAPIWLESALTEGVYHILARVISVMLPPMAIFFPLFSLLEDIGYLPRIAFNLDHYFQRCHACGKQALTMTMGLGCNAVGVTGCRIIDSRREQLLAILTNSFMPCNGRFPLLILLLGTVAWGQHTTLLTSFLLLCAILSAVALTFAATWTLSRTVLKGQPSSFTLELPPFRRPAIGQVLIRAFLDKTLSVLGRAALVAAPAGLVIWCLGNLTLRGAPLLSIISELLDPLGHCLGLDGAILLAFLLGFPANETVLPILLMIYTQSGTLTESAATESIRAVLLANGWQWQTAVSMLIFTLFHWPCSTTLFTVYKETKSIRYTMLSAALPTAAGVSLCVFFHFLCNLFT